MQREQKIFPESARHIPASSAFRNQIALIRQGREANWKQS